jgi:branched-chain amino acid transport system substrate-binding protein
VKSTLGPKRPAARPWSIKGAAAALACGVFALTGIGSAQAFDGELKVGVQIALTGALSALGEPGSRGITYAAEQINKAGGLEVDGKKYEVKLIIRDDASNPETARAVVQRLITEDKVDVIVAGVGSNIVAGVIPVIERYQIPTITTFAYSPRVMAGSPKYGFVNVMSIVDQFEGPLAFLKENGVTKVALAASNDDLGEGFVQEMPKFLDKYQLELVHVERFETNTTNFAPIMARLKATGADAIIVEAADPLSYQFRVAQAQYRACETFKFSVYEYGPPLQPDWVNGTKEAGIGGIGQSFWWPTQKGFDDKWLGNNELFVKAFQEATGKPVNWATAQGAQSMVLMGLAVEKAGKIDGTAIAEAFLKLDGTTFYGPIKFDPKDHFNRGFVQSQLVLQQQGPELSDAKIVFPAAEAEAAFIPDTCAPKG